MGLHCVGFVPGKWFVSCMAFPRFFLACGISARSADRYRRRDGSKSGCISLRLNLRQCYRQYSAPGSNIRLSKRGCRIQRAPPYKSECICVRTMFWAPKSPEWRHHAAESDPRATPLLIPVIPAWFPASGDSPPDAPF